MVDQLLEAFLNVTAERTVGWVVVICGINRLSSRLEIGDRRAVELDAVSAMLGLCWP